MYLCYVLFVYRPCGQISSRCGVDVHCMGPPLSAVLPDGKGTLLSPLFSRSHVQLHAIWLAVTYASPLLREI